MPIPPCHLKPKVVSLSYVPSSKSPQSNPHKDNPNNHMSPVKPSTNKEAGPVDCVRQPKPRVKVLYYLSSNKDNPNNNTYR